MNRTGTAVVGGLVALGFLIVLLSSLFAQRYPPPPERPPGEVGRFVVVRSSAEGIIIMDTTTGDLYNAVPSDIKPYAARHRQPPPPWEKGALPKGWEKGGPPKGPEWEKAGGPKGFEDKAPPLPKGFYDKGLEKK